MKKKSYAVVIILFVVLGTVLAFYLGQSNFLQTLKQNTQAEKTIISKALYASTSYLNGLDLLNEVSTISGTCENIKICLKLQNNNSFWYGTDNRRSPIPISDNYFVKLSFDNNIKNASVDFIGKFADLSEIWWQGLLGMYIFPGFDTVNIVLRDGNSEDYTTLSPVNLNRTEDDKFITLLMVIKNKGNNILFMDTRGNIIKELDLNKETNNRFPNGLFPANKFYIGAGLAPYGEMTIFEFYGFPLL